MSYLFNKIAPGVFEKETNIKKNNIYLKVTISPDYDCEEAADFGPAFITCYDEDGNSIFSVQTEDDEEYWPDEDFNDKTFLNASLIKIEFTSNHYAEKSENGELDTIDIEFTVNGIQICGPMFSNDKVQVSFELD